MSRLAALLPHAAAPASVAELEEAERRFGTRLPPDLRDFLLVSHGSTWTAFAACSFQIHPRGQTFESWSLPQEHRAGPQQLIDIGTDRSRERLCFGPLTDQIVPSTSLPMSHQPPALRPSRNWSRS